MLKENIYKPDEIIVSNLPESEQRLHILVKGEAEIIIDNNIF